MERNGLPGGIFSGVGSSMLGLEVAVPHQQQQNPQNPQNQQNPHHLPHPQMVAYSHHESDLHPQQSAKQGFSYASAKPRQQSSLSDEDEPGFTGDDSTSDGKRKISPWQRMKWTDNMVRLLIMAVYYIGDEVGSEAIDPTGKKKAGGLSQKKGKWKSVSRAMMEKGFFVSPQQCEDKFNDLNKRYKRVNDILGKGTACRVVENQNLLDTMDLSPKRKDEVKKLLNSKHLFFREMCAYHNSCGHSTTGVASGTNHSPEVATDQSHAQPPQVTLQQQQQQQQQQQRCSHSSENAHIMTNSRAEMEARRVRDEEDDEEDVDNSDQDDDVSDDDEDGCEAREGRGQNRHVSDGEDDHDEKSSQKRPRKEALLTSSLMQRLNGELTTVVQDGAKSLCEKKQYMKLRLLQLEEQQVSYQYQAIELEKQRVKWVKFSSKKEREMERAKLENERSRLENDKMVLCIRQKELELLHHHSHQQQMSSNKRSDPSSITG